MKNILIVDDMPMNQFIMNELLTPYADAISLCSNGEEAIEMTKHQVFDIIFMDIHMPIMDGITATKIIRQNEIYKEVPIIVLTGDVINVMANSDLSEWFDDYLIKPINEKNLINLMEKYNN